MFKMNFLIPLSRQNQKVHYFFTKSIKYYLYSMGKHDYLYPGFSTKFGLFEVRANVIGK